MHSVKKNENKIAELILGRMSDLAPFVAAALRDKSIHDLMEENRKLRELAMAVEVTGPEGQPIYARGKFDEDGDSAYETLYEVKLSEQLTLCPLSDLSDVEIWIGGSIRASFNGDKFSHDWELFHGDDEDGENEEKEIKLSACFQPGTVWLSIKIGWSQEEMDEKYLKFPDGNGDDMLSFVCENLTRANPSKYCTFTHVTPATKQIKKLVKSVTSTTHIELERTRKEFKNYSLILNALNDIIGSRFQTLTVEMKQKIIHLYLDETTKQNVEMHDDAAVQNFIANNMQELSTVLAFIENGLGGGEDE